MPAPQPFARAEAYPCRSADLRHLRHEGFGQALTRSRCGVLRHIPICSGGAWPSGLSRIWGGVRGGYSVAQGEGTAPRRPLRCRQEKRPAAAQKKSGIETKGTERGWFSEACPLRERHARAPSPLREPEYGRAAPAGLRHLRREAFAQALIRSRCADLRHIPAEGRFFSDEAHERSQKRPLKRGIVMEPLPGPDFLSFVAYAVCGA